MFVDTDREGGAVPTSVRANAVARCALTLTHNSQHNSGQQGARARAVTPPAYARQAAQTRDNTREQERGFQPGLDRGRLTGHDPRGCPCGRTLSPAGGGMRRAPTEELRSRAPTFLDYSAGALSYT